MSRTALVHEWLAARTGSEKTFEQLAQVFPDADLYALSVDPDVEFELGGRPVVTTNLDRSLVRDRRALTLPMMPLAWDRVPVPSDPYELVVTSSHAFANLSRPTADADVVLCYCHTPARYLWVPGLDGRSRIDPLLSPARRLLRSVDRRGAARVTAFAANSTEVAGRIEQFYGRDAVVIPPPVDVEFFAADDDSRPEDVDELTERLPERYVLAMSRFIPYKRIDLAIEAAAQLAVPIVVAGSGPDEDRLRELAARLGHDVRFVGRPSQLELRELYRRADALLFPALEDFGIVPIEAQACGTPVVGLAAGGALDTIVPGSTGALSREQSVEAFVEATESVLQMVERHGAVASRCREQAAGFSEERFRERIRAWAAAHV
jgi:glycosyltransferase involved in cell wall biosynthesis